jgi:hypothetical protein
MRLDEKTFSTAYASQPYGASNGASVPGYGKIFVEKSEISYLIVTQAIVLRKQYLNAIAAKFKVFAEPVNNVG